MKSPRGFREMKELVKLHEQDSDMTIMITKGEGSFDARRKALLRELESLPGEGALYGFLIRQGGALAPFPEEWRTDAALLRGCQYRVWLRLGLKDGAVQIDADSDSLISRGLMALWVRLFSGLTPGEVMAADEDFLRRSVLGMWLLPSRSNALGNMASRIKLGALKLRKEAWLGKQDVPQGMALLPEVSGNEGAATEAPSPVPVELL